MSLDNISALEARSVSFYATLFHISAFLSLLYSISFILLYMTSSIMQLCVYVMNTSSFGWIKGFAVDE